MARKKYITASNLPPRFPILFSMVGWLMLDRLDAPGWSHGAFWCFVILLVIADLIRICTQEAVDLNK